MTTNPSTHAFAETPLDVGLVAEVRDAVAHTRGGIEAVAGSENPNLTAVHAELRHLVGEKTDEEEVIKLPDPFADLVDILVHVLADYEAALTRLVSFGAAPLDPAAEYERLMSEAEKALSPYAARSDGPARAEAYGRLALIRWQEMNRER